MSNMREFFEEMEEELTATDSNMDKLKLLVEFGKELDNYPDEKFISQYKVPGCVSNVYLCYYCNNSQITFYARSDALVVAGYLSIILEGINNRNPQEIIENWEIIEEFTKNTGLKENLSPTRANAFGTILSLIYSYLHQYHEELSQ